MSEEEQFAKGYVAGYEAGLREAYDQMISLATKKCYTSTELLLVVKNQRVCVPEKVLLQKRKILKETGVDLITEKTAVNVEIEQGVAPGSSLFVKEQTPSLIFRIFNDVVQSGSKGLCVSRTPPQKLKTKVPPGCGFLWLTKFESQEGAMKEYSVQPNDLIKLYTSVKKFMTENKEAKTVIMMDGVNILISNNDFNSVLKTIQKLKDDAFIYDSVLIISADPFSMLPNEVRLIENEMQNVYDTKAVDAMR